MAEITPTFRKGIFLTLGTGSNALAVAGIEDIKPPEITAENVEYKTHDATNMFVKTHKSWQKAGAFDVKVLFDSTQSPLLYAFMEEDYTDIEITYPDSAGSWTFKGYVSAYGDETPVDNLIKTTLKIQPQTKPVFTKGSD